MSRKIKGDALWTTSNPVSGSQELLKAKDFPRVVKDRYERENLNEGDNQNV